MVLALGSNIQQQRTEGRRGGKRTKEECTEREDSSNPKGNEEDKGDRAGPCREFEASQRHRHRGMAPRKNRSDRHQEKECDPKRNRDGIEVGSTNSDRPTVYCLIEKREYRAEKDHHGEGHKEKVVKDECPFARERRVKADATAQLISSPGNESERSKHDEGKEPNQHWSQTRGRESVDRLHDSRASEKCAQNRQAEGSDGQREVPNPQQPASLLNHNRVDVGRPHEPRHEGGILDWVPTPKATPPENLIAPPGTKNDTHRQGGPGKQRPATGVDLPGLSHSTRNQHGDSKCERNGETHHSDVQQWRVNRYEWVVLQQGIRPRPARWNRSHAQCEGVGRSCHESEKEGQNSQKDGQCPSNEKVRTLTAIPEQDSDDHERKHEPPQEDRALES